MPGTIRPPLAVPSPPAAAAAPHPSWWRGLHAFALDLGASLDPARPAAAAMRHVPELLDAAFLALRLPGRQDALWSGGGAAGERAAEAALEDMAGVAVPAEPGVPTGVRAVELAGGRPGLYAPLRQMDGGWGVLLVGWSAEAPADAAVRVAAVAEHLSAALARAAAHAELRKASLRRDQFFSSVSHDLRTPISAIMGYGELLHDGIVGALTAQQAEMVERINRVAGELSQLLSDVLDLARLDAGRMAFHLETGSVASLIDEAVREVAPAARGKSLEVRQGTDAGELPPLRADRVRVRQVLVSLLANAVDSTEAGTVAITAGEEHGAVWIEVADTGPGLPVGGEESVFDDFLETAASGSARPGARRGLGLAVSRRLARAMGGDLVARDRADAGAAFTLYLPRLAGSPEPTGA